MLLHAPVFLRSLFLCLFAGLMLLGNDAWAQRTPRPRLVPGQRFPPQVYGRPKADTPAKAATPPQAAKPTPAPYKPDSAISAIIDPPTGAPIKNLKLLDEYPDGKGNIVRVVRFNQGNMIVTQTIIMPKPVPARPMEPVRLDTLDKRYVEIVVDKSKYMLTVLYRKKPIRRYRAVFGPSPLLDKNCEGDRCTPEGVFRIANKNPGSKYTRFLGINYPNDVSYARFNAAKKAGTLPSSASIGGNVGIHGIWPGGDDMIEMGVGWTDGCVAIRNRDIEELFSIADVGTPVLIRK